MKKFWVLPLLALAALVLVACSESEPNALATGDEAESSASYSRFPTMAELSERLDLSESQQTELASAFEDLHVAMASRHDGASAKGDRFPMLDFVESASSILSSEQFVAMAEVADEHHDKIAAMTRAEKRGLHRQHAQEREAAGPPDAGVIRAHMEARHARMMEVMTNVLELSGAQQASLTELFDSQKRLHEQMLASDERPSKEEMHRQHQAMISGIQEVLDDDQFARFEALQSFGWGMRRGRHH